MERRTLPTLAMLMALGLGLSAGVTLATPQGPQVPQVQLNMSGDETTAPEESPSIIASDSLTPSDIYGSPITESPSSTPPADDPTPTPGQSSVVQVQPKHSNMGNFTATPGVDGHATVTPPPRSPEPTSTQSDTAPPAPIDTPTEATSDPTAP